MRLGGWLRSTTLLVLGGGATILMIEVLFRWLIPPLLVAALLDETAHLATTLLFLSVLGLGSSRLPFVVGAAVGTVLIDLDHLPQQLGWSAIAAEESRPYTHSLLMVGIVAALALVLRGDQRTASLGVAFGIAAHLVRDMATGGVLLFWPLTTSNITLPYVLYALMLLIALGHTLYRGRAKPCRPESLIS
jgi:membrane-bound metal-dependent hydrolase YbcI (DUF457 family)